MGYFHWWLVIMNGQTWSLPLNTLTSKQHKEMYQSRACVELDSRAISMRELFSAGTKLIPHFSAHNPAKHFRDLIFLVGFDIEYCFPSWMLVCGSRPSSFPLPLDPPPPPFSALHSPAFRSAALSLQPTYVYTLTWTTAWLKLKLVFSVLDKRSWLSSWALAGCEF